MTDPFSLVYAALWTMVESSPAFTTLVRAPNRIKYSLDANRDPNKDQVMDADLPELILVGAGASLANLHATSCGAHVTKEYSWLLSTGDQRIHHRLFPVQWALLCAWTKWKETLGALEWNGTRFVHKADVVSIAEGLSDPEKNRGIKGWSSVISVEIHMSFAVALMADYATEEPES